MPGGRPPEYKEEYIDKIDEYLEQCVDEEVQTVKLENEEKGYTSYENKLKVNLPTMDGFARFIDVPRRTIYDWKDKYPEFSHSLEKIVTEQKTRLINSGLSGDYSNPIAKLILSSNHGMSERTDITSGGKRLTMTEEEKLAANRALEGASE